MMERIIMHWTAGHYVPTDLDLSHYHFVIDGTGQVHKGVPVALNEKPLKKGYAAHTLNCNSNSIGIAVAGMASAIEKPFSPGTCPIKRIQIEVLIAECAKLARAYNIPVGARTILSHAEVQNTLGIQQRGKWDIAIFPYDQKYNSARECGDYIRMRIKELL